MTTTQFYYWCHQLESWGQCTDAEYLKHHQGKSYVRIHCCPRQASLAAGVLI